MGIYDRDYYRGSGPSFLGSFLDRGRVCKWLVGVNVAVFVIQLITYQPAREIDPRDRARNQRLERGDEEPPSPQTASLGAFTDALDLKVDRVLHGEVWRLLTYAFLHSISFWHILWNMLLLWWFGQEVEDLYGPREFLVFYLVSAVLSGAAFVVAALLGFYAPNAEALGASGAVTAVLVLFAFHYPTRTIWIFGVLPMPIWLFIGFSVLKDLFSLFGPSDGVASACHLGGAAFAFLYYRFHWRISPWIPNFGAWSKRRARPRLRVYREEEPLTTVAVPAAPSSPDDEQLEAKMDAILEKISRSGKDSLTDSERELLLRASEIYRRRRT